MRYDINRDLHKNIDTPVILFEGVHKDYREDIHAVNNVSFEVRKGDFIFIVGNSGSGKSTLIKLMMREIKPSKGKVFVNGKDLGRMRRHAVAKFRRTIGVVFQDFRLLQDRTVYENVAFAQQVIEVPAKEIAKRVPKVLSIVGLSEKLDAYPKELSGGEQQRVALARALVNNPLLLLADEPTGNLDPKNSLEIMKLLEEVNRRGTTVIVVTHNKEIVDMMQKRVIMMNKGRIITDTERGGYRNV